MIYSVAGVPRSRAAKKVFFRRTLDEGWKVFKNKFYIATALVANLMCPPANSALYRQQEGK